MKDVDVNYKKQKLTQKEVQNELFKILDTTVKFLNKNNINYYLYAGTLLGAIRHKGFIPWDDDIDLILIRPEYDKLIKILKENNCKINERITAIGCELDNDYNWPFLKIINKNIVVETSEKCDKNLWIDVFVYDAINDRDNIYFKKIKFFRSILVHKRCFLYKTGFPNKAKYKSILYTILGLPFSLKTITKKYVNYCKKYNYEKADYVCNLTWGSKFEYKINKKLLENSQYEFEASKFNSFKNFDIVLKTIYGDYMKLPPKNKRYTHSFDAYKLEDKLRDK